jgi:hypothetical protein
MAQAVSRRLLADARVRCLASPCGVFGGKIKLVRGLHLEIRMFVILFSSIFLAGAFFFSSPLTVAFSFNACADSECVYRRHVLMFGNSPPFC